MIRIICGDMLTELPNLDADSLDACVTDPPYHLQSIHKRFAAKGRDETSERYAAGPYGRHATGFMGKQWDGGDIASRVETWEAVWRVLKPGAYLLAFGGPRTFHRMVCAIEDAGFEIRDTIAWIYGSGFPKSLNVAKAIDKAAGINGTVVPQGDPVRRMIPGADQNKTGWGRIYQPGEYLSVTDEAAAWNGRGTALKPAFEPIIVARKPLDRKTVAANVLAHGTGAINIDACRVPTSDDDMAMMDAKASRNPTGKTAENVAFVPGICTPSNALGRFPANVLHDGSDEVEAAFAAFGEKTSGSRSAGVYGVAGSDVVYGRRGDAPMPALTGDSGTASRFFYSAKASSRDRADSKHPTVKPLALMRWLVKLVTPPGGIVLDPFCGTGSTLLAADQLQFNAIGIEQDATYAEDTRRKLMKDAPLFTEIEKPKRVPLFGDAP